MNNEQINIAIAKACGWNREFDGNHEEPEWYWIPPNDPDGDGELPDYCNDLNAMHEAEETLQGMQRAECAVILNRVAGRDWPNGIGAGCFAHIHATARQRAEAFLRTIGKWKEEA